MVLLAGLLIAAVSVPSPAVQVCLRPLWEPPCGVAPLRVEGTVVPYGVVGAARVVWTVDGEPAGSSPVTLRDQEATTHLLLLEPRRERHRVVLEVRRDDGRARAVLDVDAVCCPFDAAIEDLALDAAGRVTARVVNRGPSPTGPGWVRWLVDGVRVATSRLPSLDVGDLYEEVLPASALPSDRAARVTLLLDLSTGDLDPHDNALEIVVRPARRH